MSDEKQPGVKIDADLWERFRNDIEARKGAIRGHLKTELENALRQYMGDGEPSSARMIDNRLSRIENHMGIAGTDGGTTHASEPENTHTRQTRVPDTKPSANSATEKKVAWLASCVRDTAASDGELREVARKVLKDTVKEEYGFRKDTAKRYVGELVDYFNLTEHPEAGDALLVTEDRRAEILRQEADEQLEDR